MTSWKEAKRNIYESRSTIFGNGGDFVSVFPRGKVLWFFISCAKNKNAVKEELLDTIKDIERGIGGSTLGYGKYLFSRYVDVEGVYQHFLYDVKYISNNVLRVKHRGTDYYHITHFRFGDLVKEVYTKGNKVKVTYT